MPFLRDARANGKASNIASVPRAKQEERFELTPRINPGGSNSLREFRLPFVVPTPHELLDYWTSTLSHYH